VRTRRRCTLTLLTLALSIAPGIAGAAPGAVAEVLGRQWATAGNGADVRWRQADAWCSALEAGGHDDWRLPTLDELETLHDPDAPDGVRAPLRLDGCCLWSSTSLVDLPAEDDGGIGTHPSRYRWGFLFDAGIRYYSIVFQPDGRALCTRDGA
jgi:hypothetical protein